MISERLRLAVQSLLVEGFIDDLAQKTDRGDELRVASEQATERGLPLDKQRPYLQWMLKVAGSEPFEDIVGDLVTHFQTKSSGRLKGPDADVNSYKSVNDLRRKLEAFASQKSTKEGNADVIGKFGQWTVYMPYDKESSCQLGAGTTWCTAKRSGQNLFYNYVGRSNSPIILYYVIKDNADPQKDPTNKLSIAVVNGKFDLSGRDGHVSVDADNKGLTSARLDKILGQQKDEVLRAIESHAKSISGQHPTQAKIDQMRKNWPALQVVIKDLDDEGRRDLLNIVFEGDVSPEILTKLSEDSDDWVRRKIAQNLNAPSEALTKLSQDRYEIIRQFVAKNPNTPPEILTKLSQDLDTRSLVAQNPSTPSETLVKLSQDQNAYVRYHVAKNPITPSEILAKLSQDRDRGARQAASENLKKRK